MSNFPVGGVPHVGDIRVIVGILKDVMGGTLRIPAETYLCTLYKHHREWYLRGANAYFYGVTSFCTGGSAVYAGWIYRVGKSN